MFGATAREQCRAVEIRQLAAEPYAENVIESRSVDYNIPNTENSRVKFFKLLLQPILKLLSDYELGS